MEDKVVAKRGRGRPKVYTNEKERVDAVRKSKSKYMLGKEWYCYVCDINYSLAGKHCHLNTKKHKLNINVLNEK